MRFFATFVWPTEELGDETPVEEDGWARARRLTGVGVALRPSGASSGTASGHDQDGMSIQRR